jgi:hypothetical protein
MMGNRFPESMENPECVPFRSLLSLLTIEAAKSIVTVLLLSLLLRQQVTELSTIPKHMVWSTPAPVEPPHTHQESEEPMAPASHFENAQSTGGPAASAPFVPFDDSANMRIIHNAHARRQKAVWMSTMMSSSSPVWVESN